MKTAIVYWSGTGNTEAMADALAEGLKKSGAEFDVFTSADFSEDKLSDYSSLAFGCPSMGAEELEDGEFLPMWESVKDNLSDKKIALFGSYGWGDGEWMRTWEEECAGLNIVGTCICADSPDETAISELEAIAAKLV
ncbi:MAG: flavodoxin [Clostridia bacterium]